MPQLTYDAAPPIGLAGTFANSRLQKHVGSYVSEGAVVAALLCQRGTVRDKQVKPIAAIAADVDSIIASGLASTSGIQTLTAASFNGVFGAGRIVPAQSLEFVFSSHADWDATTAVVTGEDAQGNVITESFAIPNGGNATVVGLKAFGRVTQIVIPAQTAGGGTATVGTGATAVELTLKDFPGIAMLDLSREPLSSANAYADKDPVPVMEEGDVLVVTEAATVAGDDVYVRITESGADLRGQFSSAPGTGFARLHDVSFVSTASADGLAVLRLPS
jgi:hypothetical protein